MDEYIPPSTEVLEKDNVIEMKSANFVWEKMPDPRTDSEIGKDKKIRRKESCK